MKISNSISASEIRFLDSVLSFNPVEYGNKSDTEILEYFYKFLDYLRSLNYATFYKLNNSDYSFTQLKINKDSFKEKSDAIYDHLVEEQIIAEVLSCGEYKDYSFNSENEILIFPLISSNGLLGLIILSFKTNSISEMVLKNIQLLINIVSQLLQTYYFNELYLNVEREKENEVQKISNQLAKTSRKLTAIIDSIATGIMLIDKETGTIVDANKKALEILAISKDELLGSRRRDYFLIQKRTLVGSLGFDGSEKLIKSNDGKVIPILSNTSELFYDDKEYLLESFSDISSKKKMEDELLKMHFELEDKVEKRSSQLKKINADLRDQINKTKKHQEEQQKLLLAVEHSPSSVFISVPHGKIEFANERLSKLSGYSIDEILASSPTIFFPENYSQSDAEKALKQVVEEGIWSGEVLCKHKDGHLFWTLTSISCIKDNNDEIKYLIFNLENISKQKEIEEKLNIAKEKAEEANKVKTNLINNLSHEFRTPLISILGFSELLSFDLENEDDLDLAKSINLSGQRLMETLNNVLEYSEIVSEKLKIELISENLNQIVQNEYNSLKNSAMGKEIEVYLEIPKTIIEINVDKTLLQKIIQKLISNALKFTQKGAILLSLSNRQDENKNWAVITIKDSGIGIKPSILEKLFLPFKQGSEGYSRNFDGLGLGLMIAKEYIDILKGKITVNSEENVGSEFSIWLPLK